MKHQKPNERYNHLCKELELDTNSCKGSDKQMVILLLYVEALPSTYKQVISMYYNEGLQIKEITTMIAMSESTVRNRLNYGLFLLKKRLRKMKSSV